MNCCNSFILFCLKNWINESILSWGWEVINSLNAFWHLLIKIKLKSSKINLDGSKYHTSSYEWMWLDCLKNIVPITFVLINSTCQNEKLRRTRAKTWHAVYLCIFFLWIKRISSFSYLYPILKEVENVPSCKKRYYP